MRSILLATGLTIGIALSAHAQDWGQVDEALGRPGTTQPGGVHRYSFPRSDLKVTLDGVEIKPALALGSWLAFQPMHGRQAMMMGDLVLLETEINPVLSKLVQNGIAVTAIHHHVLRAQPMTMYMHVEGHGDPVKLAAGAREAIAMSKTPLGAPSNPSATEPPDAAIAKLEASLGYKGKLNGGVYQVSIPRRDPIKMNGAVVSESMGLGIVMNFQPTGGGKVATTGDFVLIESEVQPVIKSLRESGIEVTSLHNHMLGEDPRLFFMHFWANDDAEKIGQGLKSAMQKLAAKKE